MDSNKTYEIKNLDTGKQVIIYYYANGEEETREHYAGKDGVIVTEIRHDYTKK